MEAVDSTAKTPSNNWSEDKNEEKQSTQNSAKSWGPVLLAPWLSQTGQDRPEPGLLPPKKDTRQTSTLNNRRFHGR